MRAFIAEFGDWPDMVFIGPADEAATRARHPLHLPGSTSLLSFHRTAHTHGRAAVVLERHGSLAPDVIRAVLANHGLSLVLADAAGHRLPMRELDAPAPVLMGSP
jgi:hypothetical protein